MELLHHVTSTYMVKSHTNVHYVWENVSVINVSMYNSNDLHKFVKQKKKVYFIKTKSCQLGSLYF